MPSLEELQQLPAADLDRLAAEALGWSLATDATADGGEHWCGGGLDVGQWHPTTDENQCRLLLQEVERRGLVNQYVYKLDYLFLNSDQPEYATLLNYVATASAHAKTVAAVAAILNQGEASP